MPGRSGPLRTGCVFECLLPPECWPEASRPAAESSGITGVSGSARTGCLLLVFVGARDHDVRVRVSDTEGGTRSAGGGQFGTGVWEPPQMTQPRAGGGWRALPQLKGGNQGEASEEGKGLRY